MRYKELLMQMQKHSFTDKNHRDRNNIEFDQNNCQCDKTGASGKW